jgi:hypothetical protein
MPDSHANFAYSTVATAPSPATSGTTLIVGAGDGAKFPTPPFNCTVWPTGSGLPSTTNAEIVRVTLISTDTFTITRAQEGSTARAIVIGDQIAATITAKTLTDAEQSPISSVSNSDGTLTITPTTGVVVASLALGHANTWTALQTYNLGAVVATTPPALAVVNTTPVTSGSHVQASPTIEYICQYWDVVGAAAHQATFYSQAIGPISLTPTTAQVWHRAFIDAGTDLLCWAYTAFPRVFDVEGGLIVRDDDAQGNIITGTAASSMTTTAGALTITAAAASTWSTAAGALTITSAAALTLTAASASTWSTSAGALTITSAAGATWSVTSGNLTIDAGTNVNLGTAVATAVSVGRAGQKIGFFGATPVVTQTGDVAAGLVALGLFSSASYAVTAPGIWTGRIYGFPISWTSTTSITVGYPNLNAPKSVCRDSADAAFISLVGGTQYLVSTGTHGLPLGDDSFVGTGTVDVTNSATVSTHTSSANAWTSDLKRRTCTGQFATVTSSTAVTATGSKFLSEFAVNDLIGVAGFLHSSAFVRVTAIATDTAMTVATAVTFSSGDPITCIEQPTISIAGDGASPHQVQKIAAETGANSLILTEATTGGALVAAAITVGRFYTRAPLSGGQFAFIYVGSGGSGTTAFVSTQRTTPFGLTGYATSTRRIGSCVFDNSGNIIIFAATRKGTAIEYQQSFNSAATTPNPNILSAGNATSYTPVLGANLLAPSTAVQLLLGLEILNCFTAIIPRGITGPVGFACTFAAGVSNFAGCMAWLVCDGAQAIQYVSNVNTGQSYFWVAGYMEQL